MKGSINNNGMNTSINKSERVLVHVRMRPFTEDESRKDNTTPIETFDTSNNVIVVKKDFEKKNFSYDSIFHTTSKQKELYEKTAKGVVESVLKGYNGTIFAYGQTGTGKTYTMVGDFENDLNRGIIPRAFDHIFEAIQNEKEYKYNVLLSFIQIYLETIQDLLEPSNENIRIREDPDQGVYLEGVQWIRVKNSEECASVFIYGEKNRATASTKMNAHSSRSHAIMIVKIEKSIVISPDKIKELTQESSDQIKTERGMTKSMLYLVDLAGSERIKKTKAEAIRLEEAKKINYSLLVLGNCIQSLTDPKCTHISYRDSKLTRLLQESLGGNAKTSLIVTISPSTYNLDETVSSLMFGQRAMKVQNKPMINKTVDYQALSIKLQEDLDKLNDEYALLKVNYDKVNVENSKIKSGDVYLDMQRKSIVNNINTEDKDSVTSTFSISASTIDDIKEKCAEEIRKLESFYEEVLKNKINEYENILQDIDKVLYEKENEIEGLKIEGSDLKEKNTSLSDFLKESEKEKDDLQKSVSDLMNELEEIKRLNEKNESLQKSLSDLMNQLEEIKRQNEKEKHDLQENVSDLMNQLEEIKRLTEKEKDDLQKSLGDLMNQLEEIKRQNEKNENLITNLKNENKTFREIVNIDRDTQNTQTDNTVLDERILSILDELNLMNQVSDNDILETIIIHLDDKLKTKSKLLEEKSSHFLKFIASQNEKQDENDKSFNTMKNFNSELENKVSSLEHLNQSLESKIEELNILIKDKEDKNIQFKKDFEEEITLLNVQLGEYSQNKEHIIREKEDVVKEMKLKEVTILNKNKEIEELKNKNIVLQNKILSLENENVNTNKDKEKEIKDRDRKIKELESDLKNVNVKAQSFSNSLKFAKTSFNEAESLLNKNLSNIKAGLNNIQLLKEEFGEIEHVVEEGSKFLSNNSTYTFEERNKKIESFSESLSRILFDSENFKTEGLKFKSMSPSLESTAKSFKSKSPERTVESDYTTHMKSDMINTENLSKKFKDLSSLLEGVSDNYVSLLNSFFKTTDFFSKFIKVFIKTYNDKIFENKNNNLEIELFKKNESYLKNSLICLLQKVIDNSSNIIQIDNIEDIVLAFNNLSSKVNEVSCPDLNKYCYEIVDKLHKKIYLFNNEKQMEVENINEKLIYYLREIEILKKNEKAVKAEKSSSGTNLNIVKLQSQLKLKEEEIQRLNTRLEEHLKTIKTLTNDINARSNNTSSIHLSTSEISCDKKETSGFSDLQKRMSSYEDEINQLRGQINEQKHIFEIEKFEIRKSNIETKQKIDKLTKKDASTGKYLIKDYVTKTSKLFEDLFLAFNITD